MGRDEPGDLLLHRWEMHRRTARLAAADAGSPLAGAGLDIVGLPVEQRSATVMTLEPRRVPLLNGEILPTSA